MKYKVGDAIYWLPREHHYSWQKGGNRAKGVVTRVDIEGRILYATCDKSPGEKWSVNPLMNDIDFRLAKPTQMVNK